MITNTPRIKYGWLRAVLFFISFFIFVTLFDLAGIAIVSLVTEFSFKEYISDTALLMENKMMLLMMICQLAGTIFTVWLFQRFINREAFTSIGLEFSGYKDDFISILPGGGWEDSTLEKRLVNEGGLVRAKTGGLSGVRNLAGYITSKKYGNVAFSILMNGYIDSSSRYTRVQDKIIKTIIYD